MSQHGRAPEKSQSGTSEKRDQRPVPSATTVGLRGRGVGLARAAQIRGRRSLRVRVPELVAKPLQDRKQDRGAGAIDQLVRVLALVE